MSELDQLREAAGTGVPLSGFSATVLEAYLAELLRELEVARAWRPGLQALVPEGSRKVRADPVRSANYVRGLLDTQRGILRETYARVDALESLLAAVPGDSMSEEWKRRLRAFRGGMGAPRSGGVIQYTDEHLEQISDDPVRGELARSFLAYRQRAESAHRDACERPDGADRHDRDTVEERRG